LGAFDREETPFFESNVDKFGKSIALAEAGFPDNAVSFSSLAFLFNSIQLSVHTRAFEAGRTTHKPHRNIWLYTLEGILEDARPGSLAQRRACASPV
jgi:hypothetical protein